MPKDVTLKIKADTAGAQATIGQLEDTSKKTFKKMSKDADKSGKEISDAYRKMGIRTDASIKASTANAKANFDKIKNSGKASANEIKKAHNAMTAKIKANNREMQAGAGKLSKGFGLLKSKLVGIAAAVGVVALIRNMTAAALENEVQVRKLRTQVENLGINYDEQSESIDRAIQATSKYAAVQSGDVSKVLQDLLFVTGDLEKSQEALNLVYDLAHLKSIDLKAATELVGRALSGNVETLGRYFVEFKGLNETLGKNVTLTDKAAFAQAFLNEKVAGSIVNMTRHERAVQVVKNAWASFVQFAGEKIFDVLDLLFTGVKKSFVGMLQLSKAVLFVGKSFAFWTDKLRITNGAMEILNEATKDINGQIDDLRKGMTDAGRKAAVLARAEQRLSKSSKEVAAEIKKRNELMGEEQDLIKETKKADLDAIKARLTQLKILEAARQTALQATKQELATIQAAIQNAASFAQSIRQQFQAADIGAAQAGFSETEVLIDNLERAKENMQRAREAFARGDIASAQKLNQLVADAIIAVGQVDAKQLREAGVSTRGLEEAKGQTAAMREEVTNLNAEMEQTARDKVPAITAKITVLKDEIVATQAVAKALNDELNLPTKKIHTTEFREVQAKSEGGPVKARMGKHLPGYGGGDRIPALLESGEFVLRKEAVRKMGLHAIDAINRMDMSALLANMQHKNVQKFAEGGPVQAPSDNVNVNLLMGEKTFKSTMSRNSADKFVSEIKRMNIIHGRRTPPF